MKVCSQQQDKKRLFWFCFLKVCPCLPQIFPLRPSSCFSKYDLQAICTLHVTWELGSSVDMPLWISVSGDGTQASLVLLTSTSGTSGVHWNVQATGLCLVFPRGFCQMAATQENWINWMFLKIFFLHYTNCRPLLPKFFS